MRLLKESECFVWIETDDIAWKKSFYQTTQRMEAFIIQLLRMDGKNTVYLKEKFSLVIWGSFTVFYRYQFGIPSIKMFSFPHTYILKQYGFMLIERRTNGSCIYDWMRFSFTCQMEIFLRIVSSGLQYSACFLILLFYFHSIALSFHFVVCVLSLFVPDKWVCQIPQEKFHIIENIGYEYPELEL